jgi:hypothetical protein
MRAGRPRSNTGCARCFVGGRCAYPNLCGLRKKTEALRKSSDLFDGTAFARKFEALLSGIFADSSERSKQKL